MLAAKKLADANFKNACKTIKNDLGEHGVAMIKDGIVLKSPEGRAKLEAELERKRQVAMWYGLPIGSQASLFGNDRRPRGEVVYQEGFEAGSKGETQIIPKGYGDVDSKLGAEWVRGWHAGQASIMKIKELKGAEVLRPLSDAAPAERDVLADPDPGDESDDPYVPDDDPDDFA